MNVVQASSSERGLKNLDITWRDIVADFGAALGGTGVISTGANPAGDFTAFSNFRTWALEQSGKVGLVVPPPALDASQDRYYGVNGSYGGGINNTPFLGIPNLVVLGYGATMNGLHGGALANNNSGRAFIDTVFAGAQSVTLKDIEDAALFSVGEMALIAGLDMQGFGYPPNPHRFEWQRIAAIDGAVITLESPLRHTYKDNWPNYFLGNAFELGGIGAASIVRTLPEWDCEHWIFGLRSYKPGQQTYYFVRKSILIDVVSDDHGWILGASKDNRIIAQKHTATQHEVDKLTENALLGEYDAPARNIVIQSSSVQNLEIRGGDRPINGTASRTLIHGGSSASINLAPIAYGIAEEITIRNRIATGEIRGAPSLGYPLDETLTYQGDGVFRYSGSSPSQWFMPGAVGVLRAATINADHLIFNINEIESESGVTGGAVLVYTDIVGETLPVLAGYANASLLRHTAPNLTVENCTGGEPAVELSLAPPNSPFGIITRRTFTGSPYSTVGVGIGYVMGRLVHMRINVLQAYTGSIAANYTLRVGQFHYYVINADRTVTNVQQAGFSINLKVAGERVITPSGVTGVQTGDAQLSLLTGGVWIGTGFSIFLGNGSSPVDISGEDASLRPIVTIEVLTDQEDPL